MRHEGTKGAKADTKGFFCCRATIEKELRNHSPVEVRAEETAVVAENITYQN